MTNYDRQVIYGGTERLASSRIGVITLYELSKILSTQSADTQAGTQRNSLSGSH